VTTPNTTEPGSSLLIEWTGGSEDYVMIFIKEFSWRDWVIASAHPFMRDGVEWTSNIVDNNGSYVYLIPSTWEDSDTYLLKISDGSFSGASYDTSEYFTIKDPTKPPTATPSTSPTWSPTNAPSNFPSTQPTTR
jgi:hypothetical protein